MISQKNFKQKNCKKKKGKMNKEDLQSSQEFMNKKKIYSVMKNIVLIILMTNQWNRKNQISWKRKYIRKKLKEVLQDYGKRSLMIVLYQLNKIKMQEKYYRNNKKKRKRKLKKQEQKKKKKNKKKKKKEKKKKLLKKDRIHQQPDRGSLNSQLISEPN